MKAAQTLLSTALYTSGILGLQILLMDRWLWNAAPIHAYGLIVFVVIDGALLVVMQGQTGLATIGAALISAAQLASMLGDIAVGQPSGVSVGSFGSYLLADTAFISLLATQAVILALATAALTMPVVHNHRLAMSQIKN